MHFLSILVLCLAFSPPAQALQSTYPNSSTWPTKCGKEGYACSQCEEPLQEQVSRIISGVVENPGDPGRAWTERPPAENLRIKPGQTADGFIKDMLQAMRDQNPEGGGRLNMIPMGQSQSFGDISPGNPRVLVKSPNSEMWMAFTTDPNSANYNFVEVMRFDGKSGKFKFQSFSFGGSNPHADLTGQSCKRCHKEESRPIWDTYRAWPGSLSGRDGQLESCNHPEYLTAGASCAPQEAGPDSGARAYLDFMGRIAEAREGGANVNKPDAARLRLLDIPTPSPETAPREQNAAQARAEIEKMKKDIKEQGYFHVPSFPTARENANVDSKTASNAGPDHLAFDQFQAIQACHVSNRLMEKPTWKNLRYAAAGAMYCLDARSVDGDEFAKYLPPEVKKRLDTYFAKAQNRTSPTGQATPLGTGSGAALDMLLANTLDYHSHEGREKEKICKDQLKGWLGKRERLPSAEIERITQAECVEKKAVRISSINAIADPGGVQGVAESAPATAAYLRYILEPAGIHVGGWSTSRGNGVGDGQSFSFSDQFPPMFKPQDSFQLAYLEAQCVAQGHKWKWAADEKTGKCDGPTDDFNLNKTCETLQKLSKANLGRMPASAWTGLNLRRSSSQGTPGEPRGGNQDATPDSSTAQ